MSGHSQRGRARGVRQSWLGNTSFPWNISFKSQLGRLPHPLFFRVTNSMIYSVRILQVPWDIVRKICPCVCCSEKISGTFLLTVCHEIVCPLKSASTDKPHFFWKLHINLVVFYEASINYVAFSRPPFLLNYAMLLLLFRLHLPCRDKCPARCII